MIGGLLALSVMPKSNSSLPEFFDNPIDQVMYFIDMNNSKLPHTHTFGLKPHNLYCSNQVADKHT